MTQMFVGFGKVAFGFAPDPAAVRERDFVRVE